MNHTQVNISIDDVEYLFYELVSKSDTLTSIYDTMLLGFLKRLHDLYGAKFTLFCYNVSCGLDLQAVLANFKEEFEEASDWLRFGFHWHSSDYNRMLPTAELNEQIHIFYQTFKKNIGIRSISPFIRLHYFHSFSSGSIDFSPISNYCHKVILLSPGDKSRECYDLTSSDRMNLHNFGVFLKNGLEYRISDISCEEINMIKVPKNRDFFNIYTHEWYLRGFGKREWICQLLKGNVLTPGFIARLKFKNIVRCLSISGCNFNC